MQVWRSRALDAQRVAVKTSGPKIPGTVPGLMNGDSSTAPVLPPPGPVTPGNGEEGPGVSPQQASVSELPASSKVISSSPSRLNAAEAVILGTQVSRKASMSASAEAPLAWLVHGKS